MLFMSSEVKKKGPKMKPQVHPSLFVLQNNSNIVSVQSRIIV